MTGRVIAIMFLGLGGVSTGAWARQPTDADRAKRLEAELRDEPQLADDDVKVEVNGKRVRLLGRVDSVEERLRAEEIVLKDDPSVVVEDQLTTGGAPGKARPKPTPVDRSADKLKQEGRKVAHKAAKAATEVGDMASDAWITSKIKAELMGTDGVHASGINVDTADGVVTLRGNVRSEAERQKALAVARQSRGVVKVVDQLAVVAHK